MTDLYLIAHKVRGEATFDVASKMECPICHDANSCGDYEGPECHECDGLGYWWIIPTSGHRAYPYQVLELAPLIAEYRQDNWTAIPDGLPDHYPTTSPTKGPTLAERLGLTKIVGKITRRI